ncbi:MAG: alpha/beta hydrolase [Pseudomonadota bacterium]
MKILKTVLVGFALIVGTAWAYSMYLLASEEHAYAPVSEQERSLAVEYLNEAVEPLGDGWVWESFEPEAGIQLRTGRFENPPSNPKGVVIVVPGYTAPLEMLSRSINQFHANGFLTYGFEYRGQGLSTRLLSNPEKGHVEDYATFAGDLGAFASSVRRPDLSLNIYAISQGAHITMRMAGDGLGNADRYALIVPMAKIMTGDFPYGIARVLAVALSYTGLGEMFAPGRGPWDIADVTFGAETACNANPQRAQLRDALFALDENKRVNGPTARWVYESMNSSDLLLGPDYAENINAPVIMFTAGQDTIVDTDAAVSLCDKLGNCTRQHFEASRHCIGQETDEVRDAIINASIEHFGAG